MTTDYTGIERRALSLAAEGWPANCGVAPSRPYSGATTGRMPSAPPEPWPFPPWPNPKWDKAKRTPPPVQDKFNPDDEEPALL